MKSVGQIQDAELKLLAGTLPYIVKNGRADSTVQKYQAGWQGWLQWSKNKVEIQTRPAHPFYVALYLNHLFFVKGTKGSITTAVYGIRWAHHSVGLSSPTQSAGTVGTGGVHSAVWRKENSERRDTSRSDKEFRRCIFDRETRCQTYAIYHVMFDWICGFSTNTRAVRRPVKALNFSGRVHAGVFAICQN